MNYFAAFKEHHELSLSEMGKLFKVHPSIIWKWCHGKSSPACLRIPEIAKIMGVESVDLFLNIIETRG